jgi:hypothetical protein
MNLIETIHRRLDRRARPTFVYERAATLLLEVVLLIACAVAAVTGWRSLIAAGLVGVLRLYETELRREDASVLGRHKERGGVSPLPPEKVARAAHRERSLEVVTWLWPGLTSLVMAAEAGPITVTAIAAISATLVRATWGRVVMPRWRASRVAWRAGGR